MLEPRIVLLTGERQVGKTTLCLRLTDILRQAGLKVTGLITQHTGPHDLEVHELSGNAVYPLTLPYDAEAGLLMGRFRMDPTALQQGCQAIRASFPTQIFILDEIGPLELLRGQGWASALNLLRHEKLVLAFVVVRSELLIKAICHLPASFYTVVRVTHKNRDSLPHSLGQAAIELCNPEEGYPE